MATPKETTGKKCPSFGGINIPICLCVVILLALSGIGASSGTNVTTLPGFSGTLPFALETGYVGVGELDDVQLFYYFVESQRNPSQDPLLFWLTGGPGCSCLSAFFFESGPLYFDILNYEGGLPTLLLNSFAWTQHASIIYVDSPVGTGFSYSKTQEGYEVDDYIAVEQLYEFLRKWLESHPQFLNNNLYIGGDSYSGIIVPMVVEEIVYGNEVGMLPQMNLIGYILGNPVTDSYIDDNSRVQFAQRLTLISEDLYRRAQTSCNQDYVNIEPNNTACLEDMEAIDGLLEDINLVNILEPYCGYASTRPHERELRQRSVKQNSTSPLLPLTDTPLYCHDYRYVLSDVWANNKDVQEALNVRQGTTGVWQRCNTSISYTKVVTSSVAYHKNLTAAALRALIYSGDHDMSVPHIGTQNWIRTLNLTVGNVWRAWFVDGQVAGYTERLTVDNYALTYATVKGAGHVAPEYKPKECFTMIDRFFAYYPL